MDSIVKKALRAYGLPIKKVGLAQKGYRNTSYKAVLTNGVMVNLIIYKAEPNIVDRINRLNTIGSIAAASNLPARVSQDPRILQITDNTHTRYAALYNYLPGATIPWEGYTKHHIKLLGAAMGALHKTLNTEPQHTLPLVTTEQTELNQQMRTYFTESGVQHALRNKLQLQPPTEIFDTFESILHACTKLPNQQPLHMDLVRGNILFDAAGAYKLQDGPIAISGIIDFEKTAFGHVVFDLARTYAFLLVDCKYKTEEKIYKYFFVSGYQKRGRQPLPVITYKNKSILHELTNFFLIHDFYKFLRHNPYEYLAQNEHYIRTRDILIARKLLEHT